jgi:hypothetical protein
MRNEMELEWSWSGFTPELPISDGIENSSYRKQRTCWSRIGANICVCILASTTILLAVVLAYLAYQQYGTGGLKKSKAQKPGSPSKSQGILSVFHTMFNTISGNSEAMSDSDSFQNDDE